MRVKHARIITQINMPSKIIYLFNVINVIFSSSDIHDKQKFLFLIKTCITSEHNNNFAETDYSKTD